MSELTRIPSFEQNGDNSPQALLDDLALFDDSIHSRIVGHQMEHMLSGTGMHGKSETAVELGVKALEDHIELIDGYSWAIGLADYSYRDHQDSDFIRGSAIRALFAAVETHDAEQEPSFLVHVSNVLTTSLVEEYGQPSDLHVPSPAEFDDFVVEHYIKNLPPMPRDRKPEYVSPGEEVLVLEGDWLVRGVVQEVIEHDDQPPAILNHIPEDEIAALQEEVDAIEYADGRKGFLFVLQDEATLGTKGLGPDERKAMEDLANDRGDPGEAAIYERLVKRGLAERTPIDLLHALGRAPLFVYQRYPQLIPNPDAEVQVRVLTTDSPEGILINLRDGGLMSRATWQKVRSDPLYRQIYSDSDVEFHLKENRILEDAVTSARYEDLEPGPISMSRPSSEQPNEPVLLFNVPPMKLRENGGKRRHGGSGVWRYGNKPQPLTDEDLEWVEPS